MKIALIQMTSGSDVGKNLVYLETQIRAAASAGATFILTPENSDFMTETADHKRDQAFDEVHHPALPLFSSLAHECGVWLLLGSVAIRRDDGRLNNRSYLFAPSGEIAAAYDKIHLFDVDLPSGEVRRESALIAGGDRVVVASTDFGKVGMSICYDVRFPYLYRQMAQAGATVLLCPAAFTVPTGELHWKVLLRARAIENGAFVLAPAQCGTHEGGRKTYGHSLVIDPWGKVLAEGGDFPAIIYADMDIDEAARFRSAIPSLFHDKAHKLCAV